ncbi:MAG: radical SAM protein [Candidatus Erginobacter occultus]|nr:radical SAM protein [Candidatus Erginobacter occultus]
MKSPANLIFFVTSKCACHCHFCFYRDQVRRHDPEKELTLAEIEDFARSYGSLRSLSISGGEPFLRSDLEQILDIFATCCRPRVIDIPTSGIDPARVENVLAAFCKSHPETIVNFQLSVDGPPAVHDKVRGVAGLYAQARETSRRVSLLSGRFPNLRQAIVTVFGHHNRTSVGEFYGMVEKNFQFNRLILTPEVKGTSIFPLSLEEEYREWRSAASALNRRAASNGISVFYDCVSRAHDGFRREINRRRLLGRFCGAGNKMLVLDQEGEIYPCEPLWFSFGNIRDYGYRVEKVLKSARARDFAAGRSSCHCDWSCAQVNALVGNPRLWPGILPAAAGELFRIIRAAGFPRKRVKNSRLKQA